MDKDEVLEDEVYTMGYNIALIIASILFAVNVFGNYKSYDIVAILFIFLGTKSYLKYKRTKKKRHMITLIFNSIVVVLSAIGHIYIVLG